MMHLIIVLIGREICVCSVVAMDQAVKILQQSQEAFLLLLGAGGVGMYQREGQVAFVSFAL